VSITVPDVAAGRLVADDCRLVAEVDSCWSNGARTAGTEVVCHPGCTPCCVGIFDITVLDAWRLQRGLDELRTRRPEAVAGIRDRAGAQWRALSEGFPGDHERRRLGDEEGRGEFFSRHDRLPCPVLDPEAGVCQLYAWRPLSCRTYGLPVRSGGKVLPPCQLNFGGADRGAIVEAAAIEPDPGDLEGRLLRRLAVLGIDGDMVVASALAPDEAPDSRGRRRSLPSG